MNKPVQRAVLENVEFITPRFENKAFEYWSKRFEERRKQYAETKEVLRNHVEIRLENDSFIAFWGDHHLGNPTTHTDRIELEMHRILRTPNAFVIVLGDTVDGMFWNPGQMEQIEQAPEQYSYARAMLKHLGEHNKLLACFGGDHDGWAKKMGVNAIARFTKDNNAYYMQGVGYITINIGKQIYRLALAHRFPGFSMYNPNHPEKRALNESARGADIVIGGHTHDKAIQELSLGGFGNESTLVHLHSVGPYSVSSDYSRKKGYPAKGAQAMYGTGVALHKDEKRIEDHYDIVKGLEKFI